MPAADTLSYCGAQVRRYDHDRFLTSLFAPSDRREALFAIHAFNLEVAKTREVVTEPMLGQIRLQWWRDSIAGLYEGEVRRHEVIDPLAAAVRRHGLSRQHFEQLIDAREADLTDTAPPTLPDLLAYAENTTAPLNRLSLETLGVRECSGAAAAHAAATPVGIAWALTGLIRAVPFHARQRRVYLPTQVVEEVAVEMGELFELHPHDGLARAVKRLADSAWEHLRMARALRADVPRAALPALLPATLAESHLRQLRRVDYNVFDARVQEGHPLRQAKLMWQFMRGRY